MRWSQKALLAFLVAGLGFSVASAVAGIQPVGSPVGDMTGAGGLSGTATGDIVLGSNSLVCDDADATNDTKLVCDTDDEISIEINGAEDFLFSANTFTVAASSSIHYADSSKAIWGTNLDSSILHDGSDMTIDTDTGDILMTPAGGNLAVTGIISADRTQITLGAAATTFAANSNSIEITGDAGANTIGTITGGASGAVLFLTFVDANVTITDTDATTADTVNLSSAFTSADDTVLQLVFDGTQWFEAGRNSGGGGLSEPVTWTQDTIYPDNIDAKFGTGSDWDLYFDATNMIAAGAGELYIDTSGNQTTFGKASGGGAAAWPQIIETTNTSTVQYTYDSDDNTGMMRTGADDIAIVGGGTKAFEFKANTGLFYQGVEWQDSVDAFFGTSSDFSISFEYGPATDAEHLVIGTGDGTVNAGNIVALMETADRTADVDMDTKTNPTLWIHSADATDAADKFLLSHNQTDALIEVGNGELRIDSDHTMYGGAYIDAGGAGTAGTGSDTDWHNLVGCTADDLRGFTHSACDLTVSSGSAGTYCVHYSVSFSGNNSETYNTGIAIGNPADVVPEVGCQTVRKLGTNGDVGNTSGGCIVDLADADVIRVIIKSVGGGATDDTLQAVTFHVHKI